VTSPGGGSVSSDKGGSGDDDDIAGAQRITTGIDPIQEDSRPQTSPADVLGDVTSLKGGFGYFPAREINFKDPAVDTEGWFAHRIFYRFVFLGSKDNRSAAV